MSVEATVLLVFSTWAVAVWILEPLGERFDWAAWVLPVVLAIGCSGSVVAVLAV